MHLNGGTRLQASKVGALHKTRIVTNSHFVNGESSHWRGDYLRYKGFTYAQVLKRSSKNNIRSNLSSPTIYLGFTSL